MNKTPDISTYLETIDGLKKEIEPHIANLQASTDWCDFVGLYRVLHSVEEVADLPKTSLDDLLGITFSTVLDSRCGRKESDLAPDEQLESEPATEIEKGS